MILPEKLEISWSQMGKHLKKCVYVVERTWENKKEISLNNFQKVKKELFISNQRETEQ